MKALLRDLAKDTLVRLLPRGAFVWRLGADAERGIALTFDDGPHPEQTPRMLDLLDSQGIRGTFFLVGREVEAHPGVARQIVERGHAVGGHTFNHKELPTLTGPEIEGELDRCRKAITEATGVTTRLVRPPRGRVGLRSLLAVARRGYTLVHWSRTYSDYRRDGAEALVARMRGTPPRPRDIILLHDILKETRDALEEELPALRGRGLTFHALQESAKAHP